jgi:hypothetical protein
MRLLNPTSTFLIPALASTTVLASTALASTSASATPMLSLFENDAQLVEYWSPISTITHLASPTAGADTDTHLDHDLLRREVVTGAPAAQPTDPVQVSPITTVQLNQMVNGVPQQINVVYTQLFSAVRSRFGAREWVDWARDYSGPDWGCQNRKKEGCHTTAYEDSRYRDGKEDVDRREHGR